MEEKKNESGYAFMAFARGKESTDGENYKKVIGVGSVYVLAVNPTKAELEKLYGTEIEKEPEYVGEVEVGEDKHKVPNVRLNFIVKTDAEKHGIDLTTNISFFLRREARYNRDASKVQVIDKYGRTAWVTTEQLKQHEIPVYKNGAANIDKDYRPCYVGEEELTNFVKSYLNIPNVMRYVNGSWVMNSNPDESLSRLDHIEDYFKGKFTELKEIINLQPNNRVKCLFGVRTNDDNRQFQAVYTNMFLKQRVTDYSSLDKDLQERKAAGAYSNTEFQVCDLKEYEVQATDFSKTSASDLPFDEPTATPWD